MTVLAVPPVLPAIHRDLHLDEALVGALVGLPVLLLAAGAVWGSLLVARIGARRALAAGLIVVAIAGALRGVADSTLILFAATFVMGAGVAVSQPTLPTLVREWFPNQPALATAVYSNGFLVGEIVAASLTVPLVLPLFGHHWEPVLGFWSLPVIATVAIVLIATAHEPREEGAQRVAWWPDWRSGRTWRLGLVLGCASAAYFGSNAFIPDYLKATHHDALIPLGLTSLNLSQLPSSAVAVLWSRHVIARRWPFMLAGVVTAISAVGFAMGGGWVVFWAGTLGFSTALVFVLCLALPPLLTGPDEVHHLTAAMFTITYAFPIVAALIGGGIWDISGRPVTTFLPVIGVGVLMLVLARGLDFRAVRTGG